MKLPNEIVRLVEEYERITATQRDWQNVRERMKQIERALADAMVDYLAEQRAYDTAAKEHMTKPEPPVTDEERAYVATLAEVARLQSHVLDLCAAGRAACDEIAKQMGLRRQIVAVTLEELHANSAWKGMFEAHCAALHDAGPLSPQDMERARGVAQRFREGKYAEATATEEPAPDESDPHPHSFAENVAILDAALRNPDIEVPAEEGALKKLLTWTQGQVPADQFAYDSATADTPEGDRTGEAAGPDGDAERGTTRGGAPVKTYEDGIRFAAAEADDWAPDVPGFLDELSAKDRLTYAAQAACLRSLATHLRERHLPKESDGRHAASGGEGPGVARGADDATARRTRRKGPRSRWRNDEPTRNHHDPEGTK